MGDANCEKSPSGCQNMTKLESMYLTSLSWHIYSFWGLNIHIQLMLVYGSDVKENGPDRLCVSVFLVLCKTFSEWMNKSEGDTDVSPDLLSLPEIREKSRKRAWVSRHQWGETRKWAWLAVLALAAAMETVWQSRLTLQRYRYSTCAGPRSGHADTHTRQHKVCDIKDTKIWLVRSVARTTNTHKWTSSNGRSIQPPYFITCNHTTLSKFYLKPVCVSYFAVKIP